MYPKVVRQQLVDALNKGNNYPRKLALDDVTFGTPALLLQNQCNTVITATAKPTSVNFTGSKSLHYSRIRLDAYLRGLKVPGTAADYSNTQQVMAALIAAYALPLVATDFALLSVPQGVPTVTVQPRGDNMGFLTTIQAVLSYRG